MDDDARERLASIETKVDIIVEMLARQNGRLSDVEDDITVLKVRDGYVAGFAAAVAAIISALAAWLYGGK